MLNLFNVDDSTSATVFIDGAAIWHFAGSRGFGGVDFKKFRDVLNEELPVTRVNYFGVSFGTDPDPARKTLDWLAYNGYKVTEREQSDSRSTIAAALMCSMVDVAHKVSTSPHVIVLFGNRAEYVEPLKLLREMGNITVVLVANDHDSSELRQSADCFVDFSALAERVCHPRRANIEPLPPVRMRA